MIEKIRLDQFEINTICTAFKNHFGSEDHLWLFGSRVYPEKRGGDIDLYIETEEKDADRIVHNKLEFVSELWDKLGEQKIDVIIRLMKSDFHLPIYDSAKKEGVKLV